MSINLEDKIDALLIGIGDFRPGGISDLKTLLLDAAQENKKLRIKFGIDPTSTDIHLGHMVVIQKLKQFQELGHQAILLIGGYTAQVGDPSGRNDARPPLTAEEVAENAKTYLDQVAKVLDLSDVEVVNNADWFSKFSMTDMIHLAGKVTINQMLAKDAFGKRLDEGNPLYVHEVFYPLLQGYDSVEVNADIELGGNDQIFNLMVGRDLQRVYQQKPQHIMTMPLLVGLDGIKKMSKTSKNYIALNDSPKDMFGKTMSISDDMILNYFTLCTGSNTKELEEISYKLENRDKYNPRDLKIELAKRIVSIYYGDIEAVQAEEQFLSQFQKKQIPDDIPEYKISDVDFNETLVNFVVNSAKLLSSKGEAKRLIQGGGLKLNNDKVSDITQKLSLEDFKDGAAIIQAGKKKFIKIVH